MEQDSTSKTGDPLTLLPHPEPDELRIVVLDGANTFMAHLPRDTCEDVMDAFEKRASMTIEARTSRETHASLRIQVAEGLREDDAEARFTGVLASAVLWLAMRHWSNGDAIVDGVDELLGQGRTPVITASIADSAEGRFMPDTAWAFMVGEKIHDGRAQLAELGPEEVRMVGGGR